MCVLLQGREREKCLVGVYIFIYHYILYHFRAKMGLCGSMLTADQRDKIGHSKNIDKSNRGDYDRNQSQIKLLLLGAGESGKSTVFKQMKILWGKGFSEEERAEYNERVYNNVVMGMQALCEATTTLGIRDQVVAEEDFKIVMETNAHAEVHEALGASIKRLWQDPGIQAAWDKRSAFQILECVGIFLDKIDEISNFGYLATQEDILLTRVKTSGIVEDKYDIEGNTFVLYDVGGQRNERKKWIHCFDCVTAVIFVAALSEYDQVLHEDDTTNRMYEAIALFDEICNSKWFSETSMILFLNKKDLFETKVKRSNICDISHFADYDGAKGDDPEAYDDGVQYFLRRFVETKVQESKEIYPHVTCATDTRNVEIVFRACKDIILKRNLKGSGFME